eukprot:COSAG01_NODE_535_length_15804_cov_33.841452_13_plen_59_part_00
MRKPRRGHGLNKRATITLHFRKNFRREQLANDLGQQGGMQFLDYEPRSGRLQFQIEHF